jgi:hypothetical protein
MVLEALSAVKTMSKNLGSVLDKQIQSAKTSISTVFDKMIASTSKQALGCGEKTSSASSDAHSMWLHHKVKENWSASKTTTTTSSHAGVQSSIASVFTKLENKILSSDVQSSLKQAVTDLKNAFSDTSKLPDMLLSSILSLIKGLAEMALEVVDVIVVELCDLASEAISLLIDVLTFKIDIPFVSTLYKEISGGDSLTVLDVATLLLASFVTPVYKLAHSGKAPFSAADAKQFSSESKALSFSDSGTSTTQIYRDVYAVLQVLYGLNSAAVDVLAAGGTDSAGGYEGVLSVTLSIIDALNLLFDAPGDYTSDNFTNLKGFVSNFQGMSNLSENLLFLWNCFSICCDVASMVYEYKTGHGLQRVVSDGSWGPWVSMTFGVVAVGFSIMVYDTNMPSAVAAKDTVSEKAYLMEYAANVCEALMNCTKPMLLFDNPVTVAAVPVLDVVLSVVNGTLTALQPTSDGSS